MTAKRAWTAMVIMIPLFALAESEDVTVGRQTLHAAFILSGLAFLVPTIGGVVGIWDRLRRKPPIDQELQFYAKKADLAAVEQRIMDTLMAAGDRHEKEMEKHCDEQAKTIRDIFGRMNSIQSAIDTVFRDIMHELGVLTGRIHK